MGKPNRKWRLAAATAVVLIGYSAPYAIYRFVYPEAVLEYVTGIEMTPCAHAPALGVGPVAWGARARRIKRVSAGAAGPHDVLWWRWLRMVEEEGAALRGAIGFVEEWVVGGKNSGREVR
ncbi:MAG: hypothetical protein DVB22_002197 [Verrucomicrobia bacterium]|jgi:hypothetical protein|nr:MAG: hypothetical protein DVB22_002197 [Verrucomicrobiota bacterium]